MKNRTESSDLVWLALGKPVILSQYPKGDVSRMRCHGDPEDPDSSSSPRITIALILIWLFAGNALTAQKVELFQPLESAIQIGSPKPAPLPVIEANDLRFTHLSTSQ